MSRIVWLEKVMPPTTVRASSITINSIIQKPPIYNGFRFAGMAG